MTRTAETAFTPAERFESIRAGALSAIALTVTQAIILGLHWGMTTLYALDFGDRWDLPSLAIQGAIALISGGLFGITYRYVMRTDDYSHLRSGVVAAFGLVRALAQVEVGVQAGIAVELLALWAAETMVEFAIAAQVLAYGMRRGWVRPFPSL